jgi:hypothetical protein
MDARTHLVTLGTIGILAVLQSNIASAAGGCSGCVPRSTAHRGSRPVASAPLIGRMAPTKRLLYSAAFPTDQTRSRFVRTV